MSKTKIALCLSGDPRSSMFSFPYIYESLINLGPDYEVDIYIHSWKDFRALPLYKSKKYLVDWIDDEEFFKNIINNLSNKNTPYILENIKELNKYTYNSNSIKNTFLMYLSMQKCFNLINTSYDLYIRGRLDFYLSSPLDIFTSINKLQNGKCDISLSTLDVKLSNENIFNDQFAICNLKGANHYFNIFDDIPDLIEKTKTMNPHKWLESHLKNNNLIIDDSLPPPDLVRSSRVITAYHSPYYDI